MQYFSAVGPRTLEQQQPLTIENVAVALLMLRRLIIFCHRMKRLSVPPQWKRSALVEKITQWAQPT